MITPDEVCALYSKKKRKKITLKVLSDGETDVVLIEGKAEGLEFLGNLLLAQAKFKKDCSFSIGPKSDGLVFFNKDSTHGILIHRLPCLEKRIE